MVLNLLVNYSVQGKVVRCFLQSIWLYPPGYFVLAEALYANIGIAAIFVPSYYYNNAKTFNHKHKMEFKKGSKRGIAVLYLFEHSLISTHLSKLK